MIPLMRKTSLTEAMYTKLLNDIGNDNLVSIKNTLHNFDNTDNLYNHFISKYRYYEICCDDISVFLTVVSDVFNEHHDYYKQLLDTYNINLAVDKLTQKTSNRTDNNSAISANDGYTNTDNTHREFDLPNKTISSDDEDGYLTGKDTTGNEVEFHNGEARTNTYISDNTSVDNRDFIRLKREYLAHIRDIYEDFTDEFYDCFLHIY